MKTNAALGVLNRVIGTWALTGSHPALPGRTLRGSVTFEPVEGGAFVRMHSKMTDTEIPEGVSIFGTDDGEAGCTMLYFDSRGVARRYEVELHADGFSWSREDPKITQRYRVTIAKDGSTMEGEGSMQQAGGAWEPDLRLSYEREAK